ncbi:MAG: leucine-rich repeat domain-containing protein, partial [Selenomonadaceae bacterium]|nr:leucine-rich repeat domain-containing protein [Selenomonadaceae bacterium]
TSIKSVNIPNSVTKIGDKAFYCCSGLTEINIPNSVKIIGDEAFSTEYDVIGAGEVLQSMSLRKVNISDGVEEIGDYAFYCCENLTEITIPNSVKKIGASAFSRCRGLTEINIPSSVEIIGSCAFGGDIFFYEDQVAVSEDEFGDIDTEWVEAEEICEMNLEKINIAEGVKEIGSGAFQYCTKLTEIIIPDSVEKIGNNILRGCEKLQRVYINTSKWSYADIQRIFGKNPQFEILPLE